MNRGLHFKLPLKTWCLLSLMFSMILLAKEPTLADETVAGAISKKSAWATLKEVSKNTKTDQEYPILKVTEIPSNAEIVIMSVPKTGTYLFTKCLTLLTEKSVSKIGAYLFTKCMSLLTEKNVPKVGTHWFKNFMSLLAETVVYSGHFQYKSNRDYLLAHPEIPVIIPMRDPRDAFVSSNYHCDMCWEKNWAGGLTIKHLDDDLTIVLSDEFQKKWVNASFDEKLMMNIDPQFPLPISLLVDYEMMEDFVARRPNTLIVKFEDLIGTAGGGDDKLQKEAIKKIADFIHFKYSDEDIERVVNNLFGNTRTFREGKIGSWKKYFNPQHIALSKEHMQDLLVKYGYEKDANWDKD